MQIPADIPGMLLRPLRPQDAPDMAREANTTRIHEFVRDFFPYPYLVQHAESFIQEQGAGDPPRHWAITCQDRFCGVIGYTPQEDVYRFSAEIGYWLGESHWGRGLATAAIRALVDHMFHQTDILRVYAKVFAFNTASMRALEKAGFHHEGVAVKHVFKNARFWDEHQYYRLHPQIQ
jgi:[ribosomal protein S5]-alanine N-acetyltransferase